MPHAATSNTQEFQELPPKHVAPGCGSPKSWLGSDNCGHRGRDTHGHSSCFHSQPWWHPGHEVLRANLPQQHRVFRRPRSLCLLLRRQPLQPQCRLRPDQQPWGPVGQCLCQPTVGAASSCLVRACVAFPSCRGWGGWGFCLQPQKYPTPRPARLLTSLPISPKTHSSLPFSRRKEVAASVPKGSSSLPFSGNVPTGHKDTPPQELPPPFYETSALC